jgi:hypothetical protein
MHCFDVDPDTTMPDGDGHQFSGVADAEVDLICRVPVAPRIEPGFAAVIADEVYILRRTIKALAQKYSGRRAGSGNAPLVLITTQAANLYPIVFCQ